MPDHSCVCPDALDRCDRCDVLLDFPSLHLVAVTQAPTGLMLEVESCDPVTGCPGCGVIATGHGRVMVEMIDAPWAGRPVRIRWAIGQLRAEGATIQGLARQLGTTWNTLWS